MNFAVPEAKWIELKKKSSDNAYATGYLTASQYRITLRLCFIIKPGWGKLFNHVCYV